MSSPKQYPHQQSFNRPGHGRSDGKKNSWFMKPPYHNNRQTKRTEE